MSIICVWGFIYDVCVFVVMWVYIMEITCDIAFGLSAMILYILLTITSTTTPDVFESLTRQGFFFMYAFFSFLAIFFTLYWVAETKGLTEE